MIVDTDFPDHWKTRMLVDLLGDDEAAPVYLLRLWAHCQNRKTDCFEGLPAMAIKAICHYKGDADGLEEALTTCRFIEREQGDLIVRGWADYNAGLLRSVKNGKQGGRPKKEDKEKPSNNPEITQPKPSDNPAETDEIRGEEIREEEIRLDETREENGEDFSPLSSAQEQERLLKLRCGKLFRYTERRKWDKGENAAWKNSKAAVKSTTEEEWEKLEAFYALPRTVNGNKTYKRTSLRSLLNNWNSELSKAIEYLHNNPVDAVDTCPAGDIAKSFNDTLGAKLEMISRPTDKRRAMIRTAWKYPVIGQDLENIKKLWAEVKKSKFLMGYGQGSNFKASFDWILSDEDRIVRIMEGQFRDEKR